MNRKNLKCLSFCLAFIIFISVISRCTGKIPVAPESEGPGTAAAETPIASVKAVRT